MSYLQTIRAMHYCKQDFLSIGCLCLLDQVRMSPRVESEPSETDNSPISFKKMKCPRETVSALCRITRFGDFVQKMNSILVVK